MLKNDKPVKRYSESFKLKVLSELENGEKTKAEILKDYRIGRATLYGWIKKYSKFDLLNRHIRVETMEKIERETGIEPATLIRRLPDDALQLSWGGKNSIQVKS
jgi:transposase-like protein